MRARVLRALVFGCHSTYGRLTFPRGGSSIPRGSGCLDVCYIYFAIREGYVSRICIERELSGLPVWTLESGRDEEEGRPEKRACIARHDLDASDSIG